MVVPLNVGLVRINVAGRSGGRGDAGRSGGSRELAIGGGEDSDSESESQDASEAAPADAPRAEYVEKPGDEPLPYLPGRLKGCLKFWQGFTASRFCLSVISHGYSLRWKEGPPLPVERNNKAGCYDETNYGFVCEAIKKLRAQGAIRKCTRTELTCVLAMDVHVNSEGKRRLIVDARPVNKFEQRRKFKCESLMKEGRDIFERCKFGGVIDISHAYHHIEIAAESQKYLGIEWEGEYFMWQVLPFGLSSAPWVWVTLSAEPVAEFRRWCIKVMHYFDDLPHGADTSIEEVFDSKRMVAFLESCGFVIEIGRKCVGHEVGLEEFAALGFIIDLKKQLFRMKPVRMAKISALARELWTRRNEALPARLVAAFAGTVVSSSLAMGGPTRMRTRALYAVLGVRRTRRDWDGRVKLSAEAMAELSFWSGDLTAYDGMPIRENRRSVQVDILGASDAGEHGYGAWFRFDEGCRTDMFREVSDRVSEMHGCSELWLSVISNMHSAMDFRGELTADQQRRSSTWREAWAVCKFVEFAAPVLEGCRMRIQIDNSGLVFGLGGVVPGFEVKAYGGSKKVDIHELIVRICDACVRYKITLLPVWIPREQNEEADYLSKMTDHYDFALSKLLFRSVDKQWGPHTVDRFSSGSTVRVESGRYNARFWRPHAEGCIGIDAFSHDWSGEVNWLHAPYRLIGKVVQHMLHCKADGTLIVPWWVKAPWWPLLRRGDGKWASFVQGTRCLGDSVGFFKGQRKVGALVTPSNSLAELEELPVGQLWALRIKCSC